jgi:hypothetical protein
MKKLVYILSFLLVSSLAFAQPTTQMIKVIVAPDHEDWTYKIGEKVTFSVTVLKWGNPLKNTKITYLIGPERFETKKDSAFLKDGAIKLDGGTMTTSGFLRCTIIAKVDGKEYRNLATAAFEPEKIQPAVEMPTDFTEFWNKAKASLSKVPIDAKMTLLPERCTETVNVYHLNLQNYKEGGTTRLYGILCVPKKEGKYPALLRVPGAGVRPYSGDVRTAEKGVITLEIGIHGKIDRLNFAANYGYVDATYESSFDVNTIIGDKTVNKGNKIPGIARQTFKLRTSYDMSPTWKIGGNLVAATGQYAHGAENNQTLDSVSPKVPGYTILNLDTNYNLTSNWSLFAKVNNVFDKDYSTFGQLEQNIYTGLNEQFRTPSAPRAGWVGVTYNFGGT